MRNEIIGQANLSYIRQKSNSRLKHGGSWGIVVRKEWQNQGVGKALLLAIEEKARALGLRRLTAEMAAPNEAAKALYIQKLGYAIEGTKREAFLLDSGEFVDILVLGKLLK